MVSDTVCCPVASLTRPPQLTASCPAKQRVVKKPTSADVMTVGAELGLAEAAGTVARMVGPFEPATAWQAANSNGTPRNASRPAASHRFNGRRDQGLQANGGCLGQRVAQPGGIVGKQPLEE